MGTVYFQRTIGYRPNFCRTQIIFFDYRAMRDPNKFIIKFRRNALLFPPFLVQEKLPYNDEAGSSFPERPLPYVTHSMIPHDLKVPCEVFLHPKEYLYDKHYPYIQWNSRIA